MQLFYDAGAQLSAVAEIRECLKKGLSPVSLTGTAHIHKAQLLLTLSQDAPILAVTADDAAAKQLCEDINFMAGCRAAFPYPAKELNFLSEAGASREYEQMRIMALTEFCAGKCRVLCASAEAAMQFTVPKQELLSSVITLKTGGEYPPVQLAEMLVKLGYIRCEQVEAPCQFSVRGDIVDIFPTQETLPVRIEFWGDEIDTISWFEPENQRRTDTAEEITISPAKETLADSAALAERLIELEKNVRGKQAAVFREKLLADADLLKSGVHPPDIDLYFPLMYSPPATVFDYCTGAVVLCETSGLLDAIRGVQDRYTEDVRNMLENGRICKQLSEYYLDFADVLARFKGSGKLICMNLFLASSSTFSFAKTLSVEASQLAPWSGNLSILLEDLREYLRQDYAVTVCSGTDKTTSILMQDLTNEGIDCALATEDSHPKRGTVMIMRSGISAGFAYPEAGFVCIAQSKTQNTVLKKRKYKKGQEIRALSEISKGDLVVHAEYGIGRFLGIEKVDVEGVTKDYIKLGYAGTDTLFVPATQLDMVSRYIGAKDDENVKLSKLGSSEWQKTRTNVKKAVKDMAAQLIKLYAAREKAEGFAFSPDDETQTDFERRFPYVETNDQLRCISEIKQDMERARPMDRLLCGDVGFGKTEVAFRAALKCILSGKQCVLLAPTTVLANQHYQTALRRFDSVPINIELLSRFRTKKQQTEILKDVANGKIDLLIGTHRVISQDVKFGALGLAIIDEEQRFGVAAKERFKTMFHGVDMLTLSATPIPRTLNMALSGIRDMSVLEEPPQDRYPVQSFVLEYNPGLIQQAIIREMKRGGQVYYIHNRVETIMQCAGRLQRMIPNARIAFAHGKMSEQEISDIWRRLVDYEIDILVCTTIIETGVDVPNVNTLILEQADRFGLAQLYQLRGRVGRSNRRAYAYFTYQPNRSITEVAEKRLSAMREFTQFGSGFHIAVRDLEIRGAGSILGGQQHGQMEQVGYEMYLKMLNDAIAEEKGEKKPAAEVCSIDVQMDANIPESYIESMTTRLEIYRRVALIRTESDKDDMIDELIDRFGDPPRSVINLIQTAMLRNIATAVNLTSVKQRHGSLFFYFIKLTHAQVAVLFREYGSRIGFNDQSKPYYFSVRMERGETSDVLLPEIVTLMLRYNK
ncbi:MAG: transcription-repair coupling factor [Oscillospiraceae bacterium]|nr:transcription-repair coupling factor [Oscillospiraceae bacterium]